MAYTIKAQVRTETGKGPVRRLRRNGRVPAVMYGHGDPSLLLTISAHEFSRLIESIKGHTPIVEVEIEGQGTTRCVIKTIQRNPIDDTFLHVDFQKVHPDEKITMAVPVILHGTPEGVKVGGMLEQVMREVPVRATIDKIPEHFDIDVSSLKLGQSIHVAALKREGLEFPIPLDSVIVTILTPRKLAAAVEAAAAPAEGEAPAEPEVIREKKEAEEEAAEAEEKPKAKEEKKAEAPAQKPQEKKK